VSAHITGESLRGSLIGPVRHAELPPSNLAKRRALYENPTWLLLISLLLAPEPSAVREPPGFAEFPSLRSPNPARLADARHVSRAGMASGPRFERTNDKRASNALISVVHTNLESPVGPQSVFSGRPHTVL